MYFGTILWFGKTTMWLIVVLISFNCFNVLIYCKFHHGISYTVMVCNGFNWYWCLTRCKLLHSSATCFATMTCSRLLKLIIPFMNTNYVWSGHVLFNTYFSHYLHQKPLSQRIFEAVSPNYFIFKLTTLHNFARNILQLVAFLCNEI